MASHKSFLESPNPLKTAAGSIEHLRINDRELASYHPLTALGVRAGGANIQQAGSLDLSYLCTRDVAISLQENTEVCGVDKVKRDL